MREIPNKYWIFTVYVILTAATLAVFWQVRSFEFTTCDDDKYVTENNHILTGLTLDNIAWAFKQSHSFMWHPITSISHMLDCQIFGLKAGGHHIVNLLFHIANTLLLFTVLRRMTGAFWQGAFVAAFFALHPLNVESVAWISERKNVLSAFFWMLTMAVYIRYAKQPRFANYLLVIFVFSLALMAKPVTVTLPFALLLLDYWPLNRLQIKNKQQIFRLVGEKIPLFLLSAVLCVITIAAQGGSDALQLNKLLPFSVRFENALVSYVSYIGKMIYPSHLSVFYPHPGPSLPLWEPIVSFVLLAAVSVAVLYLGRRKPYLIVGWFWYLGTLVPVIGLMQAGSQAMADRYAYIPLIGLFIIIAWGASDIFAGWKYRKIVLSLSAIVIISALSICTWIQTSYWRNSVSLLERNLKVISRNIPKTHYHLAQALAQKGRISEAVEHLEEAIRLDSKWTAPLNSLAWFLAARKDAVFYDPHKAVQLAQQACELTGYKNAGLLDTLAVAYAAESKFPEAVDAAQKALKIAQSDGNKQIIDQIQQRLDLYKTNQPYVETNSE
jgi:tetratricopeptide (TPR) repeat protein